MGHERRITSDFIPVDTTSESDVPVEKKERGTPAESFQDFLIWDLKPTTKDRLTVYLDEGGSITGTYVRKTGGSIILINETTNKEQDIPQRKIALDIDGFYRIQRA